MTAPEESEFPSGTLFAEKYRIEQTLGAGAMGLVLKAYHVGLERTLAIKVPLEEMLKNSEAMSRFASEARTAARIQSEHVVRIYDVDNLSSGLPYIVMEYLEGEDLAAWLRRSSPLPLEEVVDFVLQACEALAEAHPQGIVHRDLKPANLFRVKRKDGQFIVKVLDFGISKFRSSTEGSQGHQTQEGAILGSPYYMSPEQFASSRDVDARSDIWALGVILYELISGSPPFTGEKPSDLMLNITGRAPQPLANHRPGVPAGLERVVFRCLEKRRDARFNTVAELAEALLPFGSKRAYESVRRTAKTIQPAGTSSLSGNESDSARVSARTDMGDTALASTSQAPPSKPRSNHHILLWVLGAVTLVVVAGAWVSSFERAERDSSSVVSAVEPGADLLTQEPQPVSGVHASSSALLTTTLADNVTTPLAPTDSVSPLPALASAGVTSQPLDTKGRAPHSPVVNGRKARAAAAKVVSDGDKDIVPVVSKKCEPPYTVDSAGQKHFIPECFR